MTISIVLPAFNEEGNVQFIYHEILAALAARRDTLEIIYVDDGSLDGTFDRVKEIAVGDARVKGIRFTRNFGHQAALLAGLRRQKETL